MFSLKLLGRLTLEADGPVSGRAVQRHRLALLALLGASGPRALARDKLMAWLWPERDAERARGLLNQAVHVLRQALGADAILSVGEELQLNPALVACDVTAFEQAIAAGALERAAALYAGPFLDGFFLSDAPEFERWAERERERLAGAQARLLESLAEKAAAEKQWQRAAEWWRLRVAQDPYDSRAVARLMLALETSGNRAAALHQADAHQRLLKEDLELPPAPEVHALAERLRSAPAVADTAWVAAESARLSREAPPDAAPAPVLARPGAPASTVPLPPPVRRLRFAALALLTLGAIGAVVLLTRGAAPRSAPGNAVAPSADEIAKAVARELTRRQHGDTAVQLRQQRTSSIAAYELYLRGSDKTLLRSDSAARLGLDYFRRAIALDSNYAAAWAGLARMTLRVGPGSGLATLRAVQASAEIAARKAIALDDSLAEAHATLGLVLLMRHAVTDAEAELRDAVALEPDSELYREWLAKVLVWTDQFAEALAETRRAVQLAPLSPTSNAEVARALLANGRCDEALAQLEKLTNLEPPLARVTSIQTQCYVVKRRWPEVLAATQPSVAGGAMFYSGLYGYALAGAGRRNEAVRFLDTLLERGRTDVGMSWHIALVYLGLGDLDRAVPWLDRAAENEALSGAMEMAPLAARLLDSLRTDPRIARLRQRMGLPN